MRSFFSFFGRLQSSIAKSSLEAASMCMKLMAKTHSSNNALTDPVLQPFLSPTFSPSAYLNTHLPSYSKTTPLASLFSETQSHLSTLSAHTARLSATLTSLTDDILRCSSRLAYEVEILRGETVGLAESLGRRDGSLGEAIGVFVPKGLEEELGTSEDEPRDGDTIRSPSKHTPISNGTEPSTSDNNGAPIAALAQLQELHSIRASLLSLKTLFSRALSWPLPPSLINSSSGSNVALSIQPPPTPESERLEREGQASLRNMRSEISDLLAMGNGEAARRKVEELRELSGVWKGTREEKARKGVVDGLEGMVEEWEREREEARKARQPAGHRSAEEQRHKQQLQQGQQIGRSGTPGGGGSGGTGLLGNLRRLREEMYIE